MEYLNEFFLPNDPLVPDRIGENDIGLNIMSASELGLRLRLCDGVWFSCSGEGWFALSSAEH